MKEETMQKHFVTFYSPGTFVHEETTRPIEEWNVEEAVEMSKSITERYGATPFGFQFTTRARKHDELDSKEIAESPMYYLGGEVLTLDDVKRRNDPDDKILISNMECNGWMRIVENNNSYRITLPLTAGDVVLPSPAASLKKGKST